MTDILSFLSTNAEMIAVVVLLLDKIVAITPSEKDDLILSSVRGIYSVIKSIGTKITETK